MTSRDRHPADATLADMEPWAVTFRLPKAHLERLLKAARKAEGRPADFVSVAVLHLVPEDPMQAALQQMRLPGWDAPKETLYVRVPPPITWRLNRLVEQTLTLDPTVTRSRLVALGALLARGTAKSQLVQWREELHQLEAQETALPDWPLNDVLDSRRPHAGRRMAPGRLAAQTAARKRGPSKP